MKIAIISTDKINVDEHFGKADRFLIYEMDKKGIRFLEERLCVPLSINDPNHSFDPGRFAQVLESLGDCERVYMTKIGKIPKEKLRENQIEPVIYKGAIKDIKYT